MALIDEIVASTRERVRDIEVKVEVTKFRDPLKRLREIKRKGNVPVISEVKPSSPSGLKGDIPPAEAARIALQMQKGGAAAISVLTEPKYFNGSMDNLRSVRDATEVPILRKDFIIDEKQIYETDSDLILLIARILNYRLKEFVSIALSHGIQPLVEVHNQRELESALKTDTGIIGVNNRNLDTLEIDLGVSEELIPAIKKKRPELLVISESGIHDKIDVRRVMDAGADAILVGTSIITGDILEKTKELVGSS
ncbi:MAG: indole-3-glycerol-phosphate synthase [Halobacteriota archaeon]|nr:indole-3-glycerol-phosphate synthase [Halobacteriota archaeon]